jgi:hypothetical protein
MVDLFCSLALYSRSILAISLCYALLLLFCAGGGGGYLDVCENNASIWCMTFIFPSICSDLVEMVIAYGIP